MHAFDNGAAQAAQAEWKRNMISSGQLPPDPEPETEVEDEA